MVVIYGSQNDVLLQEGLADAIDKDGFITKLASLKPAWKVIAPGYFIVGSKIIVQKFSSNALTAREKQSIKQRFSTNALDAKHRLQKKALN